MGLREIMIDAVKGRHIENYSNAQTSDAIRNALIEANGGSNRIDINKTYKGTETFALIQELTTAIIDEGFKADDPLFKFVEYRNIADGDVNEFFIERDSLFLVADAAAGVRGVRRQRIDNSQNVKITTSTKVIRVYDELNRFLSGKITFDKLVDNVAKSYKQQVFADAYKAISEIGKQTAGLGEEYVVAGTVANNEEALLELVQHVEAASGKTACIYGTKVALRKLKSAELSNDAKNDLYNMGYYGKFNGTDMICMRQVHKAGTSTFMLDDSKLYVIAGDDKFVKVISEGMGYLAERDAIQNADLTQEYLYAQASGVGIVCANKLGIFTMA